MAESEDAMSETDAMQCSLADVLSRPCICFILGMLQLEVVISASMLQETVSLSL